MAIQIDDIHSYIFCLLFLCLILCAIIIFISAFVSCHLAKLLLWHGLPLSIYIFTLEKDMKGIEPFLLQTLQLKNWFDDLKKLKKTEVPGKRQFYLLFRLKNNSIGVLYNLNYQLIELNFLYFSGNIILMFFSLSYNFLDKILVVLDKARKSFRYASNIVQSIDQLIITMIKSLIPQSGLTNLKILIDKSSIYSLIKYSLKKIMNKGNMFGEILIYFD